MCINTITKYWIAELRELLNKVTQRSQWTSELFQTILGYNFEIRPGYMKYL